MKTTLFLAAFLRVLLSNAFSADDPGFTEGQFAVSPNGSSSYSIPIKCPPGTAGIQPSIAIAYDSQAPNSALGNGWSIQGLSVVTRGAKNVDRDGITEGVSFTKEDALFLDGGRLIPVKRIAANEMEYRNEVDNFSRIVTHNIGPDGPESLEVWTKAGLRLQFGETENSRIKMGDGRLLLWACNRITDTVGNYMDFVYETNDSGDYNISEIRYTGNSRANPPLIPYASIHFNYDDVAQPVKAFVGRMPLIDNQQGTPIIKNKRLKEIVSAYGHSVMRRYSLKYEDTDRMARFRLLSLQEFGSDGRSFPPTTFKYNDASPGWYPGNNFAPISLVQSNDGKGVDYVDLDGDGKTDLVFSASFSGKWEHHTYLSTGNGWKTDDSRALPFPLVTHGNEEKGYQFVKFAPTIELKDNSNNLVTIPIGNNMAILRSNQVTGQPLQSEAWIFYNGAWIDSGTAFHLPVPIAINGVADNAVKFVDLNGDGVKDAIWSRQLPDGTIDKGALYMTKKGWKPAPAKFVPPFPFATSQNNGDGVFLVDANCDGHDDLIYHRKIASGLQKFAYLRTPTGWKTQSDSSFELPFDPVDNAAAIKFLHFDDIKYLAALVSVEGGPHGTYTATTSGWRDAHVTPPVPFVFSNGDDTFVRVCRLNDDGFDDLICNTTRPDGQSMAQAFVNDYANNPNSPWKTASNMVPPHPLAENNVPLRVWSCDLKGDKRTDLAFHSGNLLRGAEVRINNSPNGWVLSVDFASPIPLVQEQKQDLGIRFADLNGDGRMDLLVRSMNNDKTLPTNGAHAYLNEQEGWIEANEFAPPAQAPTFWEKQGDWGTRIVDIDGDGVPDIVVARQKADGTPDIEHNSGWINKGVKQPTHNPGDAYKQMAGWQLPVQFVREDYGSLGASIVDVNGDGLADVFFSRFEGDDVNANNLKSEVYRNSGQGNFTKTNYSLPVELVDEFVFIPPGKEQGYEIPDVKTDQNTNLIDEIKKHSSRDCNVVIADLNGDGIPDITYWFDRKGVTIEGPMDITFPDGQHGQGYRLSRPASQIRSMKGAYLGTINGWVKADNYAPPEQLDTVPDNAKLSFQLVDVNGDGLPDMVFSEKGADGSNKSRTYLNQGNGWNKTQDGVWQIPLDSLANGDGDQGYRLIDLNGDGLLDILFSRIDEDGSFRGGAYINSGVGWTRDDTYSPQLPLAQFKKPDTGTRVLDVNGDGLPDLICSRSKPDGSDDERAVFLSCGQRPDMLQQVTNGLGLVQNIRYQSVSEKTDPAGELFYEPAPPSQYPIIPGHPSAFLVQSIHVQENALQSQDFSYRYGGFRMNIRGGRPLGFEWRETHNNTLLATNQTQGMWEKSTFNQSEYALCGRSKRLEVTVPHGAGRARYQYSENTWQTKPRDALPKQNGSGALYQIYTVELVKSRSESHDLDGTLLGSEIDAFQFDDFGNTVETLTTRSDNTAAHTINTFRNNDVTWLLGRLLESTVTLTGESGSTLTRKAEFAYDLTSGLISKEVTYAGTSESITRHFTYDSFGNKTRITTNGAGMAPRSTQIGFDSLGRFPINQTNDLGHTSSTQYEPKFGSPIKVTDVNGVVSSYEYDSHGRRVKSTSPTGIVTTVEYNWLPNGNPQGGVFSTETRTGGLPPSTAWFDIRTRVVRASKVGAGGRNVVVDTDYDVLGRTTRVSDVHFETDPPLYTTFEDYDILNRAGRVKTPDGGITKFRYIGYKTIATDKLGRICESETNLRKLTTRIKDSIGGVLRYEYDAGDRLVRVVNADGTQISNRYDIAGRRIESHDPDLGTWRYKYDPLGELLTQTDAKGNQTTLRYDKLGRPINRKEADRDTVWEYDTSPNGIGSLAHLQSSDGYSEQYIYDNIGRPISTNFKCKKQEFAMQTEFDEYNRVSKLRYPTGFEVKNTYDQWGFFVAVTNPKTGDTYWKADGYNEKGRVIHETLGNGVSNVLTFSRTSGYLKQIESKDSEGTEIQKIKYSYDLAGNVLERKEMTQRRTEEFKYDDLDRLRRALLNQKVVSTLEYGISGNILKKAETGHYTYAESGPAHGVKAVYRTEGHPFIYTYDDNGNMLSGPKGQFVYTAANQVKTVECDKSSAAFQYTPSGVKYYEEYWDHEQHIQTLSMGLYERISEEMTPPFAPGRSWMTGWQYNLLHEEQPRFWDGQLATNERIRHRHYIMGASGLVAVHEQLTELFPVRQNSISRIPSSGSVSKRSTRETCCTAYLTYDGLGSIKLITDIQGKIIERLDYNVWGERLESPKKPPYHTLRNGFTRHEHLDNLGLIHMGGRVYDPDIGRFVSADTAVDGADSSVGYNRYAYVANNPLKFSDPTGHFGFGDIVGAIGGVIGGAVNFVGGVIGEIAGAVGEVASAAWTAVKAYYELQWNAIKAAGKWIGENWKTVVVVAAVVAVSVFVPGSAILIGALAGAVGSGLSTALYGGSFSDIMESTFKGAVIGAITAGAFSAVGSAAQAGNWSYAAHVGAHAAVGGTLQAAQGGNFFTGALTSGLTQAAAPGIDSIKGFQGAEAFRVGAAAVVGGTTSAIGGGKFENGAVLGAFGRAFNDELHQMSANGPGASGSRGPASSKYADKPWLDPADDHCGSKSNGSEWIPDTLPDGMDMRRACYLHDKCYDTCGVTKFTCDVNLGADIVKDNWWNPHAVTVGTIYFSGVTLRAQSAYDEAQQAACRRIQINNAPNKYVIP